MTTGTLAGPAGQGQRGGKRGPVPGGGCRQLVVAGVPSGPTLHGLSGVEFSRSVILHRSRGREEGQKRKEWFSPSGDIGQCLETFLVVTLGLGSYWHLDSRDHGCC